MSCMTEVQADEATYPRSFFRERCTSRSEAFGMFVGRMAAVFCILIYELARSLRAELRSARARRRLRRP